jgi:hypothetical protein
MMNAATHSNLPAACIPVSAIVGHLIGKGCAMMAASELDARVVFSLGAATRVVGKLLEGQVSFYVTPLVRERYEIAVKNGTKVDAVIHTAFEGVVTGKA